MHLYSFEVDESLIKAAVNAHYNVLQRGSIETNNDLRNVSFLWTRF